MRYGINAKNVVHGLTYERPVIVIRAKQNIPIL